MSAPLVHSADAKLEALELSMICSGQVIEFPVEHRFTPGLYSRQVTLPAGSLNTSKIHKTEHQYVILRGKVSVAVYCDGELLEVKHIEGPSIGVTRPGYRRVVYAHEETVWITFHPIEPREHGDVDAIEERIIERRELPCGKSTHELYIEALNALTAQRAPNALKGGDL
jgi:hypothetical protein